MKRLIAAFALVAAFCAVAAPSKIVEEVVAGNFPKWTGVVPKNYLCGRKLESGSELRHRITLVIEFDADKTLEQLCKTGPLGNHNGISPIVGHGGQDWTDMMLPRDVMVIFVARNLTKPVQVTDVLTPKTCVANPDIGPALASRAPVYRDVTFDGAPDNGGKFPFVYIMGREGKTPLLKEHYSGKTPENVFRVIESEKKKLIDAGIAWHPFCGFVTVPKYFKDIGTALDKGKPLDSVETKLQKAIASADPEEACEAQMLYDALVQTRCDYIQLLRYSWKESPHAAAYNLDVVTRCWPKVKKDLIVVADGLKSYAAAQPLIRMYPRIAHWAEPDFKCKNGAEAKKIVATLNKMKKTLAPLKEDGSNIIIQNCAIVIDAKIDGLVATMSERAGR